MLFLGYPNKECNPIKSLYGVGVGRGGGDYCTKQRDIDRPTYRWGSFGSSRRPLVRDLRIVLPHIESLGTDLRGERTARVALLSQPLQHITRRTL